MSIWLQITAGQGPAECQWVVGQVLRVIEREATEAALKAEVLEAVEGEEKATFKSVFLVIDGEEETAFAERWAGTIQWIGRSAYRPSHKRRNWFVGVNLIRMPEIPEWSERELEFQAIRSSGPGGQHVNKTSSAIRVTHLPTGITTVAQEERSQQRNRQLALARLAALFQDRRQQAEGTARKDRWQQHAELERGNPVRVYQGESFQLKSGPE